MSTSTNPESFSLDELCVLTDLAKRTVRYYVQIGLVNRPHGETRAARYDVKHLEQLLLIKKWTAAGVSLERIHDLLQGEAAPVPPRPRTPGAIEVCSHVLIADGIELVIDPGRANLSPEQLRRFVKALMQTYAEATEPPTQDSRPNRA